MAEIDQVRPLAPSRDQQSSSDDEEALIKTKHLRRIKLCGCVSAISFLIFVIVSVILSFTVFKAKDPIVTTNNITLTNLDFSVNVNPMTPSVKVNMSLLIDMSIKNPNSASFKFRNATTAISYRGVAVAEVKNPPGIAKARRTFRMNVTADVLADRLATRPELFSDVMSGHMTLNTYTEISGRVKVLVIKKHAEIKMNCTVNVDFSSKQVQDMNCKRKVKI
ncbi:hypothetical protein HN51_046222 [Arachis hypogaea]|uniref:Late embryogenesis abundant protein LEA-2 subgroup domain-containing protein n=1 Tax=Arachis hypogaea TaxID=3818 RepID=A0A445ABQ5_ARAHY|nr:uncharacterized protein LOC107628113 [Arachis ipaensis]XP_025635254.1 uncharacterized protein LOC112729103 [Arachis hypogaea]QHO22325.1 Late embryogenesis abundant protein [Arachis hypogaea]RYR23924.1 hypothetical protein Ahy_B02g057409 [Arachis hypogaea]